MGTVPKNAPAGNVVFLSIISGLVCEKVKEGTPDAVERVNKNGEKIFELQYGGVKGLITNIAITDADKSKFGKELHVKLVDKEEGKTYMLQTPIKGGYAYGFLARMSQLDLTKETEIRTYSIEDKSKPDGKGGFKINNVLVLYQDGAKVAALPKEQIPAMVKVQVPDPANPGKTKDFIDPSTNKPVWDESERIAFFESVLYGEGGVNEALIKLNTNGAQQTETEAENEEKHFTQGVDENEKKDGNDGIGSEESLTAQMEREAEEQRKAAEEKAEDQTGKSRNERIKDAAEKGAVNASKKAPAKAAAKKATTKKK